MIERTAQSGQTQYGLVEFVMDSKAEKENLPKDVMMGSIAFCIEDSIVYMFDGKEWREI